MHPHQPATKLSMLAGVFLSLLLFALILYSEKILVAFGATPLSFQNSLIFSRMLLWLWIVLLYLYAIRVEHQPLIFWKPVKNSVLFFFLSAIIVIFCVFAGSVLLEAVEKYFGATDSSKKLTELLDVFRHNKSLLFFTVFTAAIVEELYFRAYLISRLQLLCRNAYLPVILSSIAFGLAHAGFNNVSQMINTTFIGLVSAIYYSKYRKISVLIVVHFFIDIIGLYSRM